ncbi:MAG TPA: hypothetical protein VNC50_04235, partial [Planctomycetia bacterium]|nr:hypothetical protein [Planctomycetia bacterium]
MNRKGVLLAALTIAAILVAVFGAREYRRRQAIAGLPELPAASASVLTTLAPLRAAAVENPRSDSTWGVYGIALFANDFAAPAAACFAKAEEINPHDGRWPYYFALCQPAGEARLAGFRRALVAAPDQAAAAAALAEALLEAGAAAEAAAIVDSGLK